MFSMGFLMSFSGHDLLGLAWFIRFLRGEHTHSTLRAALRCCCCFSVCTLERPSGHLQLRDIDFLCFLLCTEPETVVLSLRPTGCDIFVLIEPLAISYMEAWSATGIFLWKGSRKHVSTCIVYLFRCNKPPQYCWLEATTILSFCDSVG